jgi:hypothetical protein
MFKIEKLNIIASWEWDSFDQSCSICCSSLFNDDNSKIVFGVCNHAFHLTCIDSWLSRKNTCPNCNSNWKYKENNIFNQNVSNKIIPKNMKVESITKKKYNEIYIPTIDLDINITDDNGTTVPIISSYK